MIKRLMMYGLIVLPIAWPGGPDSTAISKAQKIDSITRSIAQMDAQQQDMYKRLCAIKAALIQEKEITRDSLPSLADSTITDTTRIIHGRTNAGTRPAMGVRQDKGK